MTIAQVVLKNIQIPDFPKVGKVPVKTIEDFDPNKKDDLELHMKNKSQKLIVIVFKKQSFENEEQWLKLNEIEDIDTANVAFIEFIYPENCPSITTQRRKIIFNKTEILDYQVPDEMPSSFQILFILTPKNKTWIINKIGEPNFNRLKKHYSGSLEKQNINQLPDYYSFNDLTKFKNQFTYLITKSPGYQTATRLENNFADSLQLLRRQLNILDSLSKVRIATGLSIGCKYLTNKWTTSPKHPNLLTVANQREFNFRHALIKNQPLLFSAAFGIANLNCHSQNKEKYIELGYYSDQFGDYYKSELINFESIELFEFKNYILSVGINYILPLSQEPKKAKAEIFKNNKHNAKFDLFFGMQIDINTKPELNKFEIKISETLKESRQYQILNFDKIIQPSLPTINFSNNLKSYYSSSITVGSRYQVNHFSIFPSFFYYKSLMGSTDKHSPFQKQGEQINYTPSIFTQQSFNIQSLGISISIGYEIY